MSGHWQDRRKPSESSTPMITLSSALLPIVMLLAQQHASRPLRILRESQSPRGTAPRKHKHLDHPNADERQEQQRSAAIALAMRLASREALGATTNAPVSSKDGSARIALVFLGSVKTSPTCLQLLPVIGPSTRLFEPSSRRQPQVPIQPAISPTPLQPRSRGGCSHSSVTSNNDAHCCRHWRGRR
jgi:hypothetical protein